MVSSVSSAVIVPRFLHRTSSLKSKKYRRHYNKEHNVIRNISSTEPSNEMFVDEVSFQQQNDVTMIDSV